MLIYWLVLCQSFFVQAASEEEMCPVRKCEEAWRAVRRQYLDILNPQNGHLLDSAIRLVAERAELIKDERQQAIDRRRLAKQRQLFSKQQMPPKSATTLQDCAEDEPDGISEEQSKQVIDAIAKAEAVVHKVQECHRHLQKKYLRLQEKHITLQEEHTAMMRQRR